MMKKVILFGFIACGLLWLGSCQKEQKIQDAELEKQEVSDSIESRSKPEYFLVANRGSSTVSIFDAKTTNFISEITLPDAGAQPTYLAHSKYNNAFYVGDFANRKVVYYNASSFEYEGEIEIGDGAFHMWINNKVNQLWINNIVSSTTSVIDLCTNSIIGEIGIPTSDIPELSSSAVPHDVVISPSGSAAYVTYLDGPATSFVVMYSTYSLNYIRHEVVGGDAHLYPAGKKLYVPSQNSGEVSVHDRFNLEELDVIPYSSAHGITASKKYVFVTGIGDNKIGVIRRSNNNVVSEIDTDYNVPHNLAVNKKGKTLFLAHSGATANKVVFYNVDNKGDLSKISEYESGLNPFGVLSYK